MSASDIVILTVDSLRYDAVHSGDGTVRSGLEAIDRLATTGTGINFDDAWATAPFTRGSFPAILTGAYQWSSFPGGDRLPPDSPYLPELLQDAGYTTGGFHSNPHLDERFGWKRGFNRYFSGGFEESSTDIKGEIQTFLTRSDIVKDSISRLLGMIGKTYGVDLRGKPYVTAGSLNSRVMDWLAEVNSPIFLWVHYMDVHNPWYPEEGTVSEQLDRRELTKCYYRAKDEDSQLEYEQAKKLRQAYQGSLERLDDYIGQLLDTLQNNLSDPIIWFTSDHGELLGEANKWFHPPSTDLKLLRIPMIVNSPEKTPIEQSPVSTVDIAPTILDAVDVAIPETMDGHSLFRKHQNRRIFAESGHATGGEMRVIGESNEVYSLDDPKSIPSDVYTHAKQILQTRSGPTPKIDDDDLQEQLEALGYR